MNRGPSSPGRARRTAGMSFIEIALATIILAVALLPVFGLIQGGLIRSDVSVSYSEATEMASALMNKLMGDAVPFSSIPDTPSGLYLDPDGSVAADPGLNPVFDEADWKAEGKARGRTQDNIHYQVQLWAGTFLKDGALTFSYLVNPNVDYTQASPFDYYNSKLVLTSNDFAFSPYNPNQKPGNHLNMNNPGSAWATTPTSLDQWAVLGQKNAPHDANQNFKKLVLRVSWSGKATGRHGLGDATKELWLISFRANLGGT